MKTREQLYKNEAAGIIRAVSMYGSLHESQLYKLYPEKQAVVKNLLRYLKQQSRIFFDTANAHYKATPDTETNHGMTAAFWVLLDFIDKIQYHSVSDFPVKICFFVNSKHYEIVYIAPGDEPIINHAMKLMNKAEEADVRCIAVVEDARQIELLNIPNTCGYCTVNTDGDITYYRRD